MILSIILLFGGSLFIGGFMAICLSDLLGYSINEVICQKILGIGIVIVVGATWIAIIMDVLNV